MSSSAFGLQTLLTAYNVTSQKFGLKINAKKTEVMCIGLDSDFFVDDFKLKNVERFKYLGSYVNRNCNLNAEITARIQAASNSYYSLKQRVFDNRDTYKQCILSIFLYGSETWTLYSHEIKQLRTVQQRHLQSILKIRWNDFVSNETVLSRSNVEDIETLLAQNRLRWLGHLCRMDNTRTLRI